MPLVFLPLTAGVGPPRPRGSRQWHHGRRWCRCGVSAKGGAETQRRVWMRATRAGQETKTSCRLPDRSHWLREGRREVESLGNAKLTYGCSDTAPVLAGRTRLPRPPRLHNSVQSRRRYARYDSQLNPLSQNAEMEGWEKVVRLHDYCLAEMCAVSDRPLVG